MTITVNVTDVHNRRRHIFDLLYLSFSLSQREPGTLHWASFSALCDMVGRAPDQRSVAGVMTHPKPNKPKTRKQTVRTQQEFEEEQKSSGQTLHTEI